MKIFLRAFKAIYRPDYCALFLEGHVKVLSDYGITNITTNNKAWFTSPNVYVIIATNESKDKIFGGIRIHAADGIDLLPLEKAIGKIDPKVHTIVKNHIDKGTGELCGLWNSKEVAGLGLSLILIRAGISIVKQIKLDSLFTICADYTMPMVKRVGFAIEHSIGNNGDFIYPNENYIARVLSKINALTLENADEIDKERIFNLRDNPIQVFNEIGPKGILEIDYNLVFPILN